MSSVYYGSLPLVAKDELTHHGILGMKWGKRNGPPYPLDAEDHSKSEQKAGWRKSLDSNSNQGASSKKRKPASKPGPLKKIGNVIEDNARRNYMRKGMDKKSAKEAAEKRRKVMRNVAIGVGAAAAVGVGVYFYTQYGRNVVDSVIKEGTTIQTLSMDPDRMELGQSFYTAINQQDKDMYVGLFGKETDMFGRAVGENKKVLTALIEKDIKVAGDKVAGQVFDNLLKNDSDFKNWYDMFVKPNADAMGIMANMQGQLQNKYQGFNRYALLAMHDSYDEYEIKKFYDGLKDLGYGAVNDVNDRKFSFFNTQAVIVFDKTNIEKNIAGDLNVSVRDLTDEEFFSKQLIANAKGVINQFLTPMGIGEMSVGVLAGTTAIYDNRVIKAHNKNKRKEVEKNG